MKSNRQTSHHYQPSTPKQRLLFGWLRPGIAALAVSGYLLAFNWSHSDACLNLLRGGQFAGQWVKVIGIERPNASEREQLSRFCGVCEG